MAATGPADSNQGVAWIALGLVAIGAVLVITARRRSHLTPEP